jgi:hypothetical protein
LATAFLCFSNGIFGIQFIFLFFGGGVDITLAKDCGVFSPRPSFLVNRNSSQLKWFGQTGDSLLLQKGC